MRAKGRETTRIYNQVVGTWCKQLPLTQRINILALMAFSNAWPGPTLGTYVRNYVSFPLGNYYASELRPCLLGSGNSRHS